MSQFDKYYITPEPISYINHRNECVPYYDAYYNEEMGGWSLSGAHFPIFTAPMSSIVDDKNVNVFDSHCINAIVPRSVDYDTRIELAKSLYWIAMGLEEFENFIDSNPKFEEIYICVDMANGHMRKLMDLAAIAKHKFGNSLILMVGNIANAETYKKYAEIGVDYVRVGIGGGSVCETNTLTGVGQDLPKLIQECRKIKGDNINYPNIVADGGINSIRDIIIALALGADYVMCGRIFAKCEEACGKHLQYFRDLNSETGDMILHRLYYGMSTKRAQIEFHSKKIKPEEGKEDWVKVEYTLKEWTEQFDAAISSTMSYCNVSMLRDFIGKVKVSKYDS